MKRIARLALAALLPGLALLGPLPAPLRAVAQEQEAPGFAALLDEEDQGRFARFDDALGRAMVEAVKGGDAADLKTVRAAIAGEPQPAPSDEIAGDWRCRTIKLGGNLPLVVYSFFKCRIEAGPEGVRFTKLTGSQRTSGRLVALPGDEWGYVGADHYADEQPKDYGAMRERNSVGKLIRTGEDRMWLGMPEPHFESVFDVLELVRKG